MSSQESLDGRARCGDLIGEQAGVRINQRPLYDHLLPLERADPILRPSVLGTELGDEEAVPQGREYVRGDVSDGVRVRDVSQRPGLSNDEFSYPRRREEIVPCSEAADNGYRRDVRCDQTLPTFGTHEALKPGILQRLVTCRFVCG